MHKWFYSFYCNIEILKHPVTGQFGVDVHLPEDTYATLHWFDDQKDALEAICRHVDVYGDERTDALLI